MLFLFILSLFFPRDKTLPEYEFSIKKTGKTLEFGGNTYYTLKATLQNNTSDTLKYESMCCSYTDYYYVRPVSAADSVALMIPLCDKNVPVTLIVPPHRKASADIHVTKFNNSQAINLRIGFNLQIVKEKGFHWYKNSRPPNYIWSNTIKL